MLREVKPKNPRIARILKKREPQLIEAPKSTLLLHGSKCPVLLKTALKTFHALTKPHSVLFQKKNESIHPFESSESIEFLARKNDCGLVIFGSSSKKRPNCVTVVRVFDSKVLDMCELLLLPQASGAPQQDESDDVSLKMPIGIGLRPMILFSGSAWEDTTSPTHTLLKSIFLDLFKGEETDRVDVEGLQYLMMLAAEEPIDGVAAVIHLRWYKIRTKRSGHKLPRVELDEIGPKFDFKVGRIRQADPNLMKEAMKQGTRPSDRPRMKKNIVMDSMGDKIGRVHLGKQDLTGLQTRKMKGLKRRAGIDDDDIGDDADMMDIDSSKDEGRKRPKTG
ncbi:Brix domain containing protein [Elaphomyces granulatus]|jgi:ribosome production factor 2